MMFPGPQLLRTLLLYTCFRNISRRRVWSDVSMPQTINGEKYRVDDDVSRRTAIVNSDRGPVVVLQCSLRRNDGCRCSNTVPRPGLVGPRHLYMHVQCQHRTRRHNRHRDAPFQEMLALDNIPSLGIPRHRYTSLLPAR